MSQYLSGGLTNDQGTEGKIAVIVRQRPLTPIGFTWEDGSHWTIERADLFMVNILSRRGENQNENVAFYKIPGQRSCT